MKFPFPAILVAAMFAAMTIALPQASGAPAPGINVALRTTFDGTTPFNDTDDPGFDSGPDNGIVRTLDFVGIAVDYQFNNIPDGETRFVNVVIEGGGFDTQPSICGPQSTISADTSELNCEIVPVDTAGTVGTITHQVLVGAGRNGDTLSITAQSVTDTLASSTVSETVTLSAAPFWDAVVGDGGQVFNVEFANGRPGWLVSFPITVEADLAATGDGRGAEGLVGPIDFDIDFTMNDGLGQPYAVELYDGQATNFGPIDLAPCSANNTDYFGTPKRNAATPNSLGNVNSTSESGDWTCLQAGAGGTSSMNIANADFSPNRFPPGRLSNPLAPRKVMLSGYITVMVYEDGQIVDSLPNGGVLPIDVAVSAFDPDGLSGGSNFGAGFENTTNNTATAYVSTFPPGQWDSFYVNPIHYFSPANGVHPGYPDNPVDAIYHDVRPSFLNPAQPLFFPTQSQDDHAGDGVVYAGAVWEYLQRFDGHIDGQDLAVDPGIMCFGFDPTTSTVVNGAARTVWGINTLVGPLFGTNLGAPSFLPESGSPVEVMNAVNSDAWGSDTPDSGTAGTPIVQYGAAVAPIDGSAITCDDDDAIEWFDDPSSFDDGTGRYPGLTTVRVFWPNGVPEGEVANVSVALEANSGLPAGTFIPAQSAWANYDGTWTGSAGNWNNASYDAVNHTNVNFGDRMIVGDRVMLVAKEIVTEVTQALQPGDEVTFRLTGRIDGSPADMTLTDVLPDGMSIVSSTVTPSAVTPGANPGDPDLYTWLFPDSSGIQVVEYTAVVDPDAPDGTTLLNTLIGSATLGGQNALSQPDSTLYAFQRILLRTSSFELDVWKSTPQEVVFVDTDLAFQLNVANVATEPLTNVELIDVLPWNGDDRGSAFTGTYTLLTPTLIEDVAASAVLWGAIADPSTINPDPATNTDTWCEQANFGDPGCPTSWAQATAIKVTATEVLPGEQITIDIVLDPQGHVPADLYANDWVARASEIPFLARSGVVDIVVVGNTLTVTLVCGPDGLMPQLPYSVTDGVTVVDGTTSVTTLENLTPGNWTLTADLSTMGLAETERVVQLTMEADIDRIEQLVVTECGALTPTPTPTPTPTAAPTAAPTSPPTAAPTSPPIAAPTSPPIAAPTSPPIAAPTSPPIAASTSPPITASTSPPITASTSPPITASISIPTTAPMLPPFAAPISTPAAAATPVPDFAKTGDDPLPLVRSAALVLLLGAALVLGSRRRLTRR